MPSPCGSTSKLWWRRGRDQICVMTTDEVDRICAEFARRERSVPGFYSLDRPANLFAHQQRSRGLLSLFEREGLTPLGATKILDVGCGEGQQLVDFESWGASRSNLAGIDLLESRIARARLRLTSPTAGADLRVGDASTLPWPDSSFDIVHQNTVFTSIKDEGMKRALAGEMLRVLTPGGCVLWYDFVYDNPGNTNVKGIGASEVRSLFPGCTIRSRRVTLAPPVARRLVPLTWIGSLLLEKLIVFNTHYLACIRNAERAR